MRARPIVPALIMLAAVSCGGRAVSATITATSPPPATGALAPAASVAAAPPPAGVQVVTAQGPRFRVFSQPGPGAVLWLRLTATNDWAQPIWMPVTGGFRDADGTRWLHVRLPIRPNGSTGWVRGRDVRSRRVLDRIVVDLSAHRLWRYQGDELAQRFTVGVGSSEFPTTPGTFFVWARVAFDPPSSAYGPLALGLSGFSEVITEWVGGGRMAIHGTWNPADRGRDVSHGCVRVFNAQLLRLRDVPLGTPVLIRP